jgi:hypothetical protein
VSPEVTLALVTGLLGLLTAGILALINSWVTSRAGVDENLRSLRLGVYPALWQATSAVSRWPRSQATRASLEALHEEYRSWYYAKGGLFLSETTRARFGDVQELIAMLLSAGSASPTDVLVEDAYTELMETTSALRTALTEDLDTRRRRSARETRRRARWHLQQARAARVRLVQAGVDPATRWTRP